MSVLTVCPSDDLEWDDLLLAPVFYETVIYDAAWKTDGPYIIYPTIGRREREDEWERMSAFANSIGFASSAAGSARGE